MYNGIEYFISKEDFYEVKYFMRIYVTSKDAAVALGASNSYVNNLNKMGKIKPAKVYKVGRNHIYFYRLSELINFCKSQDIDSDKLKRLAGK